MTLDELIETVTPPKKLPTTVYSTKGSFPIIDQSQSDICGWTDDREALISEHLPLIVFGDHTCILKFATRPFAQGADGIKILKARTKIDAKYLYQFLTFRPVVSEEYKRHFSILKERPVFFSDIKTGEQQKIAECLSTLDELIGAETQKLDALQAHKKGLMQQLFPREGETLPRLRFPEFEGAEEWSFSSLGSLCKIRTGKKDANEGAENGLYPFFTCAEDHIYSNSYSFDAEAILIAGNANVGQAKYYNGKFEAYQRTYVLTDFSDIHVPYLYALLNANLRSALLAQVQVSAMSYIRLPMLEEFQIGVPASSVEQERISGCLSSLDDLLAAQSDKVEALKTHKKGLMQQLFPSPSEAEA